MRKFLFSLLAALCLALPVFADGGDPSVSFNVNQFGTGDIGKSDVFTAAGLSLTVTGYASPGVQTDLFDKGGVATGPGSEAGLGLANCCAFEPGDHEIFGAEFVQLGVGALLAKHDTSFTLGLDSLQPGEDYDIYGSNVKGQLGTLLFSNDHNDVLKFNDAKGYQYLSVTAGNFGDVNLDSASVVATPEPSTYLLVLLGTCLISLGMLTRRS